MRYTMIATLTLLLLACSTNGSTAGSGAGNSSGAAAEPPPGRRPDVIFVPTKMEVVELMLNLATVDSTDVVYDLGSGDGRIVITAASRRGARGVGIDIDPQRIRESVVNADSAGVTNKVEFRRADLFRTDLRPASAVMLYLLPSLNVRLRPKLFSELKPGTPVVSNTFEMGTWQADSTVVMGERHIYLWHIPATVAGTWVFQVGDSASAIAGEVQFTQRYQFISGNSRLGGRTDTLTNTWLHADSLRFSANVGGATTVFSGVVSGASMIGTTQSGTSWRATRRGPAGSPFPLERR
jgi:hypothetical protein